MIYSFGDSFTAGLGVDRKYEESQLGDHPRWDVMTDEEKSIQRRKIDEFRILNSYIKFFADEIGDDFKNFGAVGCSNKYIINNIVKWSYKFKPDDIVVVGWTSSLRDPVPFYPKQIIPLWGVATSRTVKNLFERDAKSVALNKKELEKQNLLNKTQIHLFWREFSKKWIVEAYDEDYYYIYNKQILYFIQSFLNYFGLRYIFFDAFELMLTKEESIIDMSKYWKGGKESLWSYIKHDTDLLEEPGYNSFAQTPRHPSVKGHKYFAKSLVKFYKELYE